MLMFLRFNLFTFLWAAIIFLLVLMPGGEMPKIGDAFSFDKIAHLSVFCVLTFLMIIGLKKQFRYPAISKKSVLFSLVISSTYAGIIEMGQYFVPDRYASLYDMAFNLTGVLFGYGFYLLIYKFQIV